MRVTFALLILLFCSNLQGQNFSIEEKQQGYQVKDNKTIFIFDPELYATEADKVVVTGSFRAWSTDMKDSRWLLKKTGSLWTLSFDNPKQNLVKPHAEFKFRINEGKWLDPPKDANNTKGGNLVFMQNVLLSSLKAEIRNDYTIWAYVGGGKRPLQTKDYKLTDAKGKEIKVAGVLPNTSTETLITTADPIDIKRVYFLEIPALNLKSHCSFDGWFREMHSTKALGANIEDNQTTIRVFSPRATGLKLYLYKGKDDEKAYITKDLLQDTQGVWEATFLEDLHGVYYDFTVHGSTDKGNFFYETKPVHITDPYARVSDDTWGKARIWRKTTPATPLKNGIPSMEDIIAYEVHVQDFTDRLPVAEKYKGTLKAMTMRGLKNSKGKKIGFDYLLDLGINTVHLMPVQEYLHFPDKDWKASFQNDQYMKEQGVSEENYQWGYRTSHCFAVESKYRTKDKEPGAERNEFRDLVQAFHNNNIAVIIDIVPNHTAENMDANEFYFNFNALDKQYYYRTKNLEHIGEYGNEVKTENRPMAQRWLIDQCKHFIEEFGIDGFRIDLAGQIDEQTLKALKTAIGEDKILYGEPWIASNDPAYEANPDWDWYKEDSPITFFQDEGRNAYKGPVFSLNDKYKDRGWTGGKYEERENVMKALINHFKDDKSPLSGISYLDIHDNFALADQFGTKNFDGRYEVDEDLYKIAVTLLYTTLGPIVTHGGSEIMRSKAHAPLKEVVKTTKAGYKVYMHGYRDTYNHRTANQFVWENVGAEPSAENKNNYKNMYAFWQGMNRLRMSDYGKVFRVSEAVGEDYYKWITPSEKSMLGYVVDEKIFVLLNASNKSQTFENIELPKGKWRLIANNQAVNHQKGIKDTNAKLQSLNGSSKLGITMPKESLKIWVRE